MTKNVRIYEVGPRDGLQNEANLIPTQSKVALIDLLSQAGFDRIEATSFVSPKWVPQLADASEVMRGINRRDGTTYAALVPNLNGFERARAAGVTEVAVFAAASEAFSQKNINCSIKESLIRFEPILETAQEAGISVRGYVSCVVACPYAGEVDPTSVRDVAFALHDMGCYEISLGDTIGKASPDKTMRMIEAVGDYLPMNRLAGHFHDTDNLAIENVAAALEMGVRTFDSSIGGLGGCPYAPGAKGNLSTSALVTFLQEHGFATGIDPDLLAQAGRFVSGILARESQNKGERP